MDTEEKTQLIILGFVLTVWVIISAICWPYAINGWLEFVGKEPEVAWWQGALIGFVPWVGKAAIPAALVTWVLLLIL